MTSQWRLFFPSLDALVAELSAYGEKMGHGLVELDLDGDYYSQS